jgi:hypothetical protein
VSWSFGTTCSLVFLCAKTHLEIDTFLFVQVQVQLHFVAQQWFFWHEWQN